MSSKQGDFSKTAGSGTTGTGSNGTTGQQRAGRRYDEVVLRRPQGGQTDC
ncbi:hypothetical protein AB0L00_41300 [Actinoallomurus sp. NPDC052308]